MGVSCRTSVASRLPTFVVLAALVLAVPGCGYPRAVRTYEYVASYDRMSDQYEPLLSLVYVPQATALSQYGGIIVGDVQVGEVWVESPEEAAGYATFFRVALTNELLKLNTFDLVSLDKDCEELRTGSRSDILLVEGKITRFHMGSGLMRYLSYFLWFLQSGATDLQIEGRISEAVSRRLVAEFVDRRRHLGNTPFGPNPRNFRRGYTMNLTVKEMAQGLAKFIELGYQELPGVLADASADGETDSRF